MVSYHDIPDRMYALVPKLPATKAAHLARHATEKAKSLAPKGWLAKGDKGMTSRFTPYSGPGYYGVRWVDNYVWYQEHGARPFTMTNLAGKTIPMWIKDPTGTEKAKNPKAKTRVREDGVTEVLIFRKAAAKGATKTITTKYGNTKQVPASYPGAPGRIALREAPFPYTIPGKSGGMISSKNVGVRWRNPGLNGRHFLQEGILDAARVNGIWVNQVVVRHPSGIEELVYL
jgi:hypothetical protein